MIESQSNSVLSQYLFNCSDVDEDFINELNLTGQQFTLSLYENAGTTCFFEDGNRLINPMTSIDADMVNETDIVLSYIRSYDQFKSNHDEYLVAVLTSDPMDSQDEILLVAEDVPEDAVDHLLELKHRFTEAQFRNLEYLFADIDQMVTYKFYINGELFPNVTYHVYLSSYSPKRIFYLENYRNIGLGFLIDLDGNHAFDFHVYMFSNENPYYWFALDLIESEQGNDLQIDITHNLKDEYEINENENWYIRNPEYSDVNLTSIINRFNWLRTEWH